MEAAGELFVRERALDCCAASAARVAVEAPDTVALGGGTGDARSSSRTTNSYSPLVDVCRVTPETVEQ